MLIGKHIFVICSTFLSQEISWVHAHPPKCWWGTWSNKVWEPLR